MKKVDKKKVFILITIAVLLLAAYLVYSRPMTISKLYPMLTLDKCTGIQGYYEVGTQADQNRFTIEKDSEEFQKLCSLFYEQSYRRGLRDLLPRGTRYHRTEQEDFQWEVWFCFEDVEFPDGSGGSGPMLHFLNWYGELDIYFDGDSRACKVRDQELWAEEILDLIQ